MASSSLSAPGIRPALSVRLARGGDLAEHHAVRRQVFVEAQRVFAEDDRDARDDHPATLHVVGLVDGSVGGAVRLYPTDDRGRRWKGDRLAVLAEHRLCRLGGVLVDFAVRTAGERGGRTMYAHIQPANVAFFRQLGWEFAGRPVLFHALVHQPMTIDLTRPFR